jgi:hypothetical protein
MHLRVVAGIQMGGAINQSLSSKLVNEQLWAMLDEIRF